MSQRSSLVVLVVLLIAGAVAAQPDLSVNNVIPPVSAVGGQTFLLNRDITNIGSPVSSFTYEVYLSVNNVISSNDTLLATINSSTFGIAGANIPLPVATAPGSYYLGIYAVPAAGETNTANNLRASFSTMSVTAAPANLQAVSVVGPASASPGQSVNVTRNVASIGGPLQFGAFTYQIRLSTDQTIDSNDPLLLQIGSTTLGPLAVAVTIPAGQALGNYHLGLVVAAYPGETDFTNNVVAATMTMAIVSASPTITSVTPNSGSALGGETITITGTNLAPAMTVSFGTTPSPNVTFLNATSIQAVAPPSPNQAFGTVDVTVTGTGGSATATGAYTYGHPYPGSGEDLQLLVGVNGTPDAIPVKTAQPGDLITMNLSSPMGAFDGLGAVLIAQLYPSAGPQPFKITGFPEVWVDTLGAIVVLDGNRPTPFGPIVYAPGGVTVPFLYPGGLAGFTGRAQAFCVTNTAQNGLFAVSDALEVTY